MQVRNVTPDALARSPTRHLRMRLGLYPRTRRCRALLGAAVLALSAAALAPGAALSTPLAQVEGAREAVDMGICFGYGCVHQASARFDTAWLDQLDRQLGAARSAAAERKLIAATVAQLYLEAGLQTPIWRDRGGNQDDDHTLAGAMDCLDHAANTTAFLRLMDQRGMLRFHRVGEPVRRTRYIIDVHWSARIMEQADGAQFVVDSWFFDLGTPAVVIPVAAWRAGAEPADVRTLRP